GSAFSKHLYDAATQNLVFPREQILRELIAALVDVSTRADEVIVDPGARRSAKIIRQREDFFFRPALVEQPLRIRTSCANREKFRGDADETREQQLFAIQFGPEPRHGVKQSARQFFACSRRVLDVPLQ